MWRKIIKSFLIFLLVSIYNVSYAYEISAPIINEVNITNSLLVDFGDGYYQVKSPLLSPPLFNRKFSAKFNLHNKTKDSQRFLVDIRSFNTGKVSIFEVEDGHKKFLSLQGSSVFSEGIFQFTPIFEVILMPDEKKEYEFIREHHFKFLGRVYLTTSEKIAELKEMRLFSLGIFDTFNFCLALMGLISSILLKDKILGLFTAFTFSVIPGISIFYGLFDYFGFRFLGYPPSHNTFLLSTTYMSFFLVFCNEFLGITKSDKWSRLTYRVFLYAPIIMAIIRYTKLSKIIEIPMSQVVDVWVLLWLIFVMIFAFTKGRQRIFVNYFIISTVLIIAGALSYYLQFFSLYESDNLIAKYGIFVGIALGVLFFYIGGLKRAIFYYKESIIPLLCKKDFINLGQVSGFLMHEIKNHLFAKQMAKGEDSEQLKQDLAELVHISETLLDSQHNIQNVEQLDIDALVDGQVELFKRNAENMGITIISNLTSKVVKTNKTAVNIILKNLIKNSLEHLRLNEELEKKIIISSCDRGIVVSNKVSKDFSLTQDQIIEPFFTTKSNLSNRGLGLYITAQLCEKLKIDFDVDVCEGTIFFKLRFPTDE